MSSLPHAVPTRLVHNIAALYGHDDDTLLAWQRFCVQAAEALRAEHDSARLTKALALAQDGAVALADDGGATVDSGTQRYAIAADGTCACADAQQRGALCKHVLAVAIHRQAQRLLAPEAAAPQPAEAPAAKRPAKARASAAWDVHEAPVSSCFKIRIGALEWTHTMRASADDELHRRVHAFLPAFRDILAAFEALHAEREAAKAAAPAALPPTAAPVPALPALVQQAVAAALAGSANGHTNGQAPGAPASDDQQTGFCTLHQAAMDLRENERGAWYSHYLDDEDRYCKGAKRPTRNGQRR